jgi:hypothetical protein
MARKSFFFLLDRFQRETISETARGRIRCDGGFCHFILLSMSPSRSVKGAIFALLVILFVFSWSPHFVIILRQETGQISQPVRQIFFSSFPFALRIGRCGSAV